MIIEIELDSDVPLYQQIRDRVVEGIADGRLHAGDSLPSTRQLASDLGINFHTVNKGYDTLREDNVLRLTRKSGAVVTRDPTSGPPEPQYVVKWAGRAKTILADAIAHGMSTDDVLTACREIVTEFKRGDTP